MLRALQHGGGQEQDLRAGTENVAAIVGFGKAAELAEQFLAKGSEVALEGRLTYRDWVDKEGNKRNITEVVSYEFLMLDKRSQA